MYQNRDIVADIYYTEVINNNNVYSWCVLVTCNILISHRAGSWLFFLPRRAEKHIWYGWQPWAWPDWTFYLHIKQLADIVDTEKNKKKAIMMTEAPLLFTSLLSKLESVPPGEKVLSNPRRSQIAISSTNSNNLFYSIKIVKPQSKSIIIKMLIWFLLYSLLIIIHPV